MKVRRYLHFNDDDDEVGPTQNTSMGGQACEEGLRFT